MSIPLLALALLPTIVLLVHIYRKDSIEKEPPKLLVLLFLGGALVTIAAAIVEIVAEPILDRFLIKDSLLYILIENFFAVALVEEAGKYLVLKKGTWKSPHFNYLFDAIVYAVVVSLGFATLENILYVLDGTLTTAIMRAVLSVPGHAFDAVYMGYFYGLAKQAEARGDNEAKTFNLRMALIAPVVIHGTYDFLIGSEMLVVFFIFEVVVTVLTIRHINQLSHTDEPL
ncbi:MAG: PrsW family glutamic-type intramembrane protease [Coriobacteriales bacterium]|nr:PrsW family glutamic-type intramembrane protease [Coriobacteriales bacterium]